MRGWLVGTWVFGVMMKVVGCFIDVMITIAKSDECIVLLSLYHFC